MEAIQGNRPAAYTYPAGTNPYGTYEARSNGHGGPGYANLPSHTDDIRRLIEESTAAKESARVLAEALVFTRPEDLEQKPIIRVSLYPSSGKPGCKGQATVADR